MIEFQASEREREREKKDKRKSKITNTPRREQREVEGKNNVKQR